MSEREIQRDGYRVVIKGKSCGGALKDVRCLSCGLEHAELVRSVAWERGRMQCPRCCERTPHVALASGGTGTRYRYADIGQATGHCRYEGLMPAQIERMERGDDGFMHGTGEWVDYEDSDAEAKRAAGKYSSEAREERRQQINAEKRRKRGSAPIFFDSAE